MPYITPQRRIDLSDLTEEMNSNIDDTTTVGEINYLITKLLMEYLSVNNESYTTINELIGVLECAKQELYRQIAEPYEDMKKYQNGDVYDG